MEVLLEKFPELAGGLAGGLLVVLFLGARKVYADTRKDLLAERASKESQGAAFLSMFSELTADLNVQLKTLELTIRDQAKSNEALVSRVQHLEDRVEEALKK